MNKLIATFKYNCLLIPKSILNNLITFTLSLFILIISTNVYSDTLFDFNFKDNLIENGFDNWSYIDKGSTSCDIYSGEEFSKLCSSNGQKFYPYYVFHCRHLSSG